MRFSIPLVAIVLFASYQVGGIASADTPDGVTAEGGALANLVGRWKGSLGDPADNNRSETNADWKVGRSHLVSEITVNPGTDKASQMMIVWSYDASQDRYTRIFFMEGGGMVIEKGRWDSATRTFHFESTEPGGMTQTRSTVRILANGSIAWTIELVGKDGNSNTVSGKNERVAGS